MRFDEDSRLVLTLDAGGTNFVFSAVRGNRELGSAIRLPSCGDDLPRCLETIVEGFSRVRAAADAEPVAISFAFPGPADYPAGIIGDLGNLPAFRGGVPLGSLLEDRFGVPVFINNDADLFAYGEAIAGLLPEVNRQLAEAGNPKRYRNLFGVTLGTGFGGGLVSDGRLFTGDNAAAAEIWILRNRLDRDLFAEEGASIRAVRQVFAEVSGWPGEDVPEPKEICAMAEGSRSGPAEAAREAFRRLGVVAGDAMANVLAVADCLFVVGGGLSGAASHILPALVQEMNSPLGSLGGGTVPRTEVEVFNFEDPAERMQFLRGDLREVVVPGTERRVVWDAGKRTAVGLSRLGTSKAVAIGAYAFALDALERRN